MKNLTYKEIRQKYLDFFKSKNHEEIPSANLVPEDDPSVLFVNAGMFPLVPFLKGEPHPNGTRLTNSQRCLRTNDIDEVGDAFHCTTFEMLGNWSLNDYFKKEAIEMTMEFFTEELELDPNRIYASVFEGDNTIPMDQESVEVWKNIFKSKGVEPEVSKTGRIQPLGRKENWWGLPQGGPCGPDSEIFYDTGKEKCSEECNVACNCGKYVEIGNNVFMEYLNTNGKYSDLGRHNVDFGGGLDRLTALSQNVDSVFETDIYKPILDKVKELSVENIEKSERIITDHIKAATWIIADGVQPSKTEQGYILRRLIRRAIRHGKKLGIEDNFTRIIGEVAIQQFKEVWPQLEEKQEHILNTLEEEEKKFKKTLKQGLRELNKVLENQEEITGETTFKLYETYGFPIEITLEELAQQNIDINKEQILNDFNQAQKEHKEKSRTASAGKFKGGLADTSEMSTKYHTTTHLLLAALREVLGNHVYQKGSNITPERLRLDYPNETKLTPEQVQQVEDLVNSKIQEGLEITYEEMPKEKALELVPFAAFSEKYGDIIKVYSIGPKENPFSVEICNGPHVNNTKELGQFKIKKQENVGAGIKRIKAILQ
jgi:alanyl-tRNA synthetase